MKDFGGGGSLGVGVSPPPPKKKKNGPAGNPAPSAETLTLDHAQIPTAMYNFLVWMMSDDTDGTAQSGSTKSDLHRRVMAVGQDLSLTAMAVKNLTGSSQVVSLLNRFGHCHTMSY